IDVEGRKGEVASWLAIFGEYERAIDMAQAYLDEITSHGAIHRRTEADAWDGIGFARAGLGNPESATNALERSIRTFIEQGNYYSAAVSTWEQLCHVVLVYQADDFDLRNRLAGQARNLWSQSRHGQVAVHPDWAMTPIYLIEGDLDRAASSAEKTLETDAWSVGPLYYLGEIARLRGNIQEARLRLSQALPRGPETEPGTTLIYNAVRFQSLGTQLALDEGEIDEAKAWTRSLRTWIDWSGHLPGECEYELLRAQIALAGDNPSHALEHARRACQHASRPSQPLALLSARRVTGEVLITLGEHEAAKEALEEAETIARNCHAVIEIARVQLARAELLIATGGYPAARHRLRECREILGPRDARPLLDRVARNERHLETIVPPSDVPGGLTRRELDVLQVIADGLTDAEAASKLGISPRTVSNHLSSIYSKIGVSSRSAATRFAVENNLTSGDQSE
ncbi:MAG: LuxR C-terminal-related transcriptional regulator, partial [Chloroflexota bacterium]